VSAHSEIEGNEAADGWAKTVVGELDRHGVEWLRYNDRCGQRKLPLLASSAHLERRLGEAKWEEAEMVTVEDQEQTL
jgi:hypothetical protein